MPRLHSRGMTNTYLRIRLKFVPTELEEQVTEHSFACGASGLAEALLFKQPNLAFDPTILTGRSKEFDVYFQDQPKNQFYENLATIAPQIQWEIFEEEEKDWLEEWKKGFEPFQLVGPYWIVPSWFESPVTPEFAIHIDPGMAFGTGTHATTQIASSFLHRKAKEAKGNALSMLDVGTGTAVLAILARKLGFGPILGIEIDPEARRVARENIARNNVDLVDVSDQQIEELHQSYDVVVANIIDGVLINLRQELLACTNLNGDLFLTGILKEREEVFLEHFIRVSPVQVMKRWDHDDWVGYWVRKVET
jgi:ribosomal protein L11 methyltransferase